VPAAAASEAIWPRTLLDALPGSVVIVEPGSARVLFANRAALELTGEESPVGRSAAEWMPARSCRDAEGRPLAEEALPAMRAARGERVRGTMVTCQTPRGERTLRATAQSLAAPDGAPVALVSFEDVTELRAAQLGERLVGEDLRAILEGVADSVTAQGPDGGLVYANEAAVRVLGFDSAEALLAAPLSKIMARWTLLTPGGDPLPLETLPGRLALMGGEPEPMLVQFVDRESGETRWSRIKARPVRDADGSVRLAINVIEDVTELKLVEQSQRFLAEASRALADSLDYEATLTAIAHLAVPGVADWCGVDLAGDPGGDIERVAVAHVDPAKVAMAAELAERYPADPRADQGVHQVLRTGESQLWPDIPDALLVEAAEDEEHLRLIRALGMVSVMVVPMRVRDRVLGVITFVSAESGRRFGDADLRLAEDLALRAATAVENARLYRARTKIAQTLQASLLPPLLPDVNGVEAGALYRPAGEEHEVGGDFYDLFATTEDQWFAVIGDVCGKGAEAAAVTALARYTIRAAAAQRSSPAAILRWVNEAMLREDTSRFCTIAIAHLDRSAPTTRLTVAVGGHPPPLILRASGDVETAGAGGTLIGLVEDPTLTDVATELAPGDAVLLYTDGVTEAAAPGRVWTPEELEAVLAGAAGASAQELVDRVAEAALTGLSAPPRDDVAILALRLKP
jgi:PAS domain S-box-containing protein